MGIFDVRDKVSNRKITGNFLKRKGFNKSRWGSLIDRQNPSSIFYEKFVMDEWGMIIVDIMYFPEGFTGYINFHKFHGIPKNTLVIAYDNSDVFNDDFSDHKVYHIDTHGEFLACMNMLNNDLIKNGYEPVKFE